MGNLKGKNEKKIEGRRMRRFWRKLNFKKTEENSEAEKTFKNQKLAEIRNIRK